MEYSPQRKYRRQKTTNNESNSVVIDDSLNLKNDSSRESNLKNVEHLHKKKHYTQKLVSVIDSKFSCTKCDKQYTDTCSLRKHKALADKGVRYPSDECNAAPFTQAGNLKTHKASAHEGVRYPCDECNAGPYTTSIDLRKHKASSHEGVRYPCGQCNAGPFTLASALSLHKASSHEGVRYECNTFDYKATTKGNLKRHCIRIHKKSDKGKNI